MNLRRKVFLWLIRISIRFFPDRPPGKRRGDIEETVVARLSPAGWGVGSVLREIFGLVWNGAAERLEEWRRHSPGFRSGVPAFGDDLRLAGRKLRKSPGFSVAVVLTLAAGIGSTVAMFSVLEAALLRSLPYPEAHELMLGRATFDGETNSVCSFPDYIDHRDGGEAFEVMAAMLPNPHMLTVTGRDIPERAAVHWVTVDFFQALGIDPARGRSFTTEEAEPNAPDVIMISHGFWQRWFGGDANVLGRSLTVGGQQAVVIGVMPAGFRFRNNTDVWAPVRMGTRDTEGRRSHSWQVVGRLRDGVTLQEAQAQMDVISAQLEEVYPESHRGKGMGFVPLGEGLAENYRPALLLLMGATALLLLIACGNVAGLLLARATSRKMEISVRAALGASRTILARQLFVESLLLATLAGAGGILLALWIQATALELFPLDLLGITHVGLSFPMLLFALSVSLGTALLFGVGPALTASQAAPAVDLKGGQRATSGGRGSRVRGGLVLAQVAVSVILLTGSGLLIRSFVQLQAVDLGFRTENLVKASLAIAPAEYPEVASRTRFFQDVLDEVRAMPGVESASFIDMVPILHRYRNWYVWDSDIPPDNREGGVSTFSRTVMPGYFETMGIPLLRGRDHREDDGLRDQPFLVISESAAEAIFPQQDPIGRRITVFNGMGNRDYEVLGVVGDIRMTRVGRAPTPQMYFGHPTMASTGMNLVARTQGDPGSLVPLIREAVLRLDPDVPLSNVSTMEEIVSSSISETRVLGMATGLFAFTALLLSMAGLYAVLAYYVGQRTREIGIRVAFGATESRILTMVLRRGLVLVVGGLTLGLAGAAASTRILQAQLYEVGTFDPITFGAVAIGFLGVGVVAALVPARRASLVDPVRAIQTE